MALSFEPYDCRIDDEKRKAMFSFALTEIRKSRGLTQSDMSKALGISQQSYSNYENGKNTPNFENLVRISFLLNCSIDMLLQRNNIYGDANDQLEAIKKEFEELRELEGNEMVQKNEDLSNALRTMQEFLGVATKALEAQTKNKS